MKKILLMGILALVVSLSVRAQESLAGRVYHCANMMKGEMEAMKSDFDKDLQKEKDATAEEKKEANKMVQGMTDAIISTMTLKFLSDKEVELSVLVKYDDAKAKANGVPWLLRKLVSGKLKNKAKDATFTGNTPYTFNGKTVKLTNPKSKKELVFQLTPDGKALLYTTNKDKTVRLARAK